MKLSIEWLKQYVTLDGITPKELAHALTMSGSKVETVEELGEDIQNVVVGRVLSIEKHPDADRLFVCSVDVNDGTPRQIITGAANVFDGAIVPAALDGALLPGGKKIKTGKMRGLESQGMLCSGSELGLDAHDQPGAGADGILILDGSFTVGEDITKALMLRDTVIEFEITNNRPDCLSVLGLARETAATLGKGTSPSASQPPLRGEERAVPPQGGISDYLTVTVDNPALCPRYSARVVKNVKIGQSPMWMRRRLRSCGVRPINNIVDITNYVMLELGQPMHAFDYACVKDKSLIVRTAREGEILETLDGKGRVLSPSMLVIADGKDATAVAGVMGGAASEITDGTHTVVFESANFNGPSVRKTALSLAMRTDASSRFEKGLDPNATITALERACQLIAELGAGEVVPGVIDVCSPLEPPVTVPFSKDKIEAFLGVSIPNLNELLGLLGITVTDNGDGNSLALIPSWRRDIAVWQDIAEEAARLFGYDNIPVTLPPSKNQGWLTEEQRKHARLNELCTSLGFDEMLTYSFIGPADLDAARIPDTLRKGFTLRNPQGEERSFMRTVMLPSMLEALSHNIAARNPEAWLYELGMVYLDIGEQLPRETRRLIFGGYGGGMDYFTLKGAVETLITRFARMEAAFAKTADPAFHPGRCAEISASGQRLGVIGELHPNLLRGLPAGTAVCELDAALLTELSGAGVRFSPLPRFPAVARDLALVCKKSIPASEILDVIRKNGGSLLEDCRLFDVFEGGNLASDTRSLAYRLVFRSPERTLNDEEADRATAKILKKLGESHGIGLRS